MQWCELYALADKFGAADLAKSVSRLLEKLCLENQAIIDPHVVAFAYENSTNRSTFRRMIIQRTLEAMVTANGTNIDEWAANTSANAVFNLDDSKALRKHSVDGSSIWCISDCQIHADDSIDQALLNEDSKLGNKVSNARIQRLD